MIDDLTEALSQKLPKHTFDAVMRRVEDLDEGEKRQVLEQVLADRRRGEALDRGDSEEKP